MKHVEKEKKENNNVFDIFEEISSRRKIDIQEVGKIFEETFTNAYKKRIDPEADIETVFDDQARIFKILRNNFLVVEDNDFTNDINEELSDHARELIKFIEIPLSEAQKINPDAQVDQYVAKEIDLKDLPPSFFKIIQQTFQQKIIEISKKNIYDKYILLKGKTIFVKPIEKVKRSLWKFEIQDDPNTFAYMPEKLQNKKIFKNINMSEVYEVYIEDVTLETKEVNIVISLVSNELLKKALFDNIPEISEGILQIERISRLPGIRSKVAVKIKEGVLDKVDIIGSIVGQNAQRISKISSLMHGEKIDVILYDPKIETFITNALSPAKVISVIPKHNTRSKNHFTVVVPSSMSTIAIGKDGSNSSLAVEITKVRMDIISWKEAQNQNLDLVWNGNLTLEEAKQIEDQPKNQLQVFTRHRKKRHNYQNSFSPSNISKIDMSEFDKEIAEYQLSIENDYTNDSDDLMEVPQSVYELNLDNINLDLEPKEELETSGKYSDQDQKTAKTLHQEANEKLKHFKTDANLLGDVKELIDVDNEDW